MYTQIKLVVIFQRVFFVYDFLPKHRSICIFVIFQVRTRLICRIIDDKSAHQMQNSQKTKNPNKKSSTILTHFINFIHTKHLEKRGVVFHTFTYIIKLYVICATFIHFNTFTRVHYHTYVLIARLNVNSNSLILC